LIAVLVADAIERREHVGGKPSGFLQHGGGDVGVEIAVMAGFHGGLQARAMVEGQQHVIDRRAVGHGRGLAFRAGASGSSLPTKPPFSSTLRWAESPRKAVHLARKEAPAARGRRERSFGEGQPDIETEMEIDRNEQPDIKSITPLIRRI